VEFINGYMRIYVDADEIKRHDIGWHGEIRTYEDVVEFAFLAASLLQLR
jgi:hypothetical protein